MHTSSCALRCCTVTWSPSRGRVTVTPPALPPCIECGTMVTFCTGLAPSVSFATSACPASCTAVSHRSLALTTAVCLATPMSILSRAASIEASDTCEAPMVAARSAAWLSMLSSSAPVIPVVLAASSSRLTSSARGSFSARRASSRRLPPMSGGGTWMIRSNLPGRRSAASSEPTWLVAASTTSPAFWAKPSISTSSALSVCACTFRSPPCSRAEPTQSISSMKTMAGAARRAAANSARTRCAPTPTYFSSKPDADAEKKGTPASPAQARASMVFPVPGTPSRSTPRGIRAPSRVNFSGSRRYATASCNSSVTSSMPTTSSKVVLQFTTGWSSGPPLG
mmetsp:Transcript_4667/g.11586  ORF Transcript_4667/g.11586 Transcript_4667/m.11586 type:complete len:338 (+) Transcript_4667:534-1547(+)